MPRSVGRPQMKVDKHLFDTLCGLQCTLHEIACAMNCNTKTIEAWCKREYKKPFREVFKEKRGRGAISLRRIQWQMAEKSPAMAIFLGKNYLGQTDKQDVELSGPDNGPIEVQHKQDLSMLSMSELMTLDAILSKVEENEDEKTPKPKRRSRAN